MDKCLAYGGEDIGTITLIERPRLELLEQMPEADVIREGGMVGTVGEFIDKYFHGDPTQEVAVIRFQYEPLTPFQGKTKAPYPGGFFMGDRLRCKAFGCIAIGHRSGSLCYREFNYAVIP